MTATTIDIEGAPRRERGTTGEVVFHAACFSAATLLLCALGGVVISLAIGGWPAFRQFGFGFLTSTEWNPVTEVYGAAGPIVGTIITSILSLAIALPLALGVAVFLVQFCPRSLSKPIAIAVELLAGIPSIVYGMWGLCRDDDPDPLSAARWRDE